jgi:hypothetical protein
MTIRGRSGRNVTGLQGSDKVLIRVLIQQLAWLSVLFEFIIMCTVYCQVAIRCNDRSLADQRQAAGIASERS